MAEKLRIHQLAKELNVDSKIILTKCRAEGVEVKNHMSTVLAGLAATIREWFSDESIHTAMEGSARVDLSKVRRKKPATKRRKREPAVQAAEDDGTAVATKKKSREMAKASATTDIAVAEPPVSEPVDQPAETADATSVVTPQPETPTEETKPKVIEEPKVAAQAPSIFPPTPEKPEPPGPVVPAGPRNVPQPVQLRGPRVIRVEAPEAAPPPVRRSAPTGPKYRHASIAPSSPGLGVQSPGVEQPSKDRARSHPTAKEDLAAKKRRAPTRRTGRGSDAGEQIREWRDRDLEERQQRLRGATGRRAKRRASETHAAVEHKAITQAEVTEPIILKDFCASTGLAMIQLTSKLVNDFKIIPNINMVLERDAAELLAGEFGIELTVVAAWSPLSDIRKEFEERERPGLTRRAPVVTFLGHVDHGKTSLLDTIRHSRVAAGEAGGITQHMGSYHLERNGLAVTFLDTPGHEAFTAMRARGAQLTDVAVLVVAADDGVMPQTIEAIDHAKAAKVPIVVALNKIDLHGVDLNKVYGQLAEHDLAPTEWGGTVDVIKTSATEGTGIDELIEHLSTLSDLLELSADPTIPAYGHVIEAQMKPGVGVVARVLIQDGSLSRSDFVVCGPGFGKVRRILDDRGETLENAGPSMPVEVSGLDTIPFAGDELFQVESLRRAEQIAEQAKQQRRRDSLSKINKPRTLEDLLGHTRAGAIPELNVIIKADTQGSVDVLRKALGKFPTEEVKLNMLHAGVGGVTESDVLLAEASGAIIIGFHVIPDNHVRRLGDEHGVDIRSYRVIYHVVDEIKLALEGLLAPEERIEQRGRAEVREIFKITKAGTVAGCYVREGTIARSHKVRILRDSVVVRDNSNIQSLRHFKDDAKEVKAGHECGIRVEGFDDVKPDDIIETYEIVKVARSLEMTQKAEINR